MAGPTLTDIAQTIEDLAFIEEVATSTAASAVSSGGKTYPTIYALREQAEYNGPIAYAGGISCTTGYRTVNRTGVVYFADPAQVPFTTSGTWVGDDDGKFLLLQPSTTGTSAVDYNFDNTISGMVATTLEGAMDELTTDYLRGFTGTSTVQVGSGETFTTLNDALAHYSTLTPIMTGGVSPRLTLNLKAGYVHSQQTIVDSIDLSWITITGSDATTTVNSSGFSQTIQLTTAIPVFGVVNCGKFPIIEQSFHDSYISSARLFVSVGSGSKMTILNSTQTSGNSSAVYAVYNGSIYCYNCFLDGDDVAAYALSGGKLTAVDCDFRGSVYGISCAAGNTILSNCDFRKDGATTTATDLYITQAGIVQSNTGTGGCNVSSNSVSANGMYIASA